MQDLENAINLLRQMPVFGGLNTTSLEFILNRSAKIDLSASEYLFEEGDAAKSFFVLTAGTVVVEKSWQGTPIELRQLGAGDCLGEMAIIDLEPRSASVRALIDCRAIEITRSTLHELYKHDLEQFAIIMMNLGREVSRRLRLCSERLFALDQTIAM